MKSTEISIFYRCIKVCSRKFSLSFRVISLWCNNHNFWYWKIVFAHLITVLLAIFEDIFDTPLSWVVRLKGCVSNIRDEAGNKWRNHLSTQYGPWQESGRFSALALLRTRAILSYLLRLEQRLLVDGASHSSSFCLARTEKRNVEREGTDGKDSE